jgi:hypothetical protein
MISCPAEVTLVRMSNDNSLPKEQRRNYTSIFNAAFRIVREEGMTPAFVLLSFFVHLLSFFMKDLFLLSFYLVCAVFLVSRVHV